MCHIDNRKYLLMSSKEKNKASFKIIIKKINKQRKHVVVLPSLKGRKKKLIR